DAPLSGPNSQQAIRTILGLSSRANWDLMATDVCICNPLQMIQLLALRRKQPDRVDIMDLKSLAFAGTTAYVINHERKARVLATLKAMVPLAMPYDLLLRRLCHDDQLQMRVIFPFATSLSCHAEGSQIQTAGSAVTERLWNAF